MAQTNGWLDAATRMVSLEFALYSPSLNHFAYVIMVSQGSMCALSLFESGDIHPSLPRPSNIERRVRAVHARFRAADG